MSSAQSLREFVTERLTAAAEEIFTVFEKTIVEYEAEIDRQRRLLEVVWKPQIKLHRLVQPQKHVCKVEVLTDQQLCDQERNSSLDQEDPEPPQIKEEPEELCTSQEGEQLVLKQETENVMSNPAHEESDHSSPVAENQNQEGSKHVDSGSTRNAEQKLKKMHCTNTGHINNADISAMSENHCNTRTGKRIFTCDTCGKTFKYRYNLRRHLRIHTGEKPYVCNTCGKKLKSNLKSHLRIHTGEKPYSCKTCGRAFRTSYDSEVHMRRVHSGERPYLCNTCGKGFTERKDLVQHDRIHTTERPYSCQTCGKRFYQMTNLRRHIAIHKI